MKEKIKFYFYFCVSIILSLILTYKNDYLDTSEGRLYSTFIISYIFMSIGADIFIRSNKEKFAFYLYFIASLRLSVVLTYHIYNIHYLADDELWRFFIICYIFMIMGIYFFIRYRLFKINLLYIVITPMLILPMIFMIVLTYGGLYILSVFKYNFVLVGVPWLILCTIVKFIIGNKKQEGSTCVTNKISEK